MRSTQAWAANSGRHDQCYRWHIQRREDSSLGTYTNARCPHRRNSQQNPAGSIYSCSRERSHSFNPWLSCCYSNALKPCNILSVSTGLNLALVSDCTCRQSGKDLARTPLPFLVNDTTRNLASFSSARIETSPFRSSGLRLAVNVVRSITRSPASAPIDGDAGRFNCISNENCHPLISAGRNASSYRRPTARAARIRCRQKHWLWTSMAAAKPGSLSLIR